MKYECSQMGEPSACLPRPTQGQTHTATQWCDLGPRQANNGEQGRTAISPPQDQPRKCYTFGETRVAACNSSPGTGWMKAPACEPGVGLCCWGKAVLETSLPSTYVPKLGNAVTCSGTSGNPEF